MPGVLLFRGQRFEPVGVRLKGNSTYQWLDGRPAWKLKFDEYEPGLRVQGLERLTLDSNVPSHRFRTVGEAEIRLAAPSFAGGLPVAPTGIPRAREGPAAAGPSSE